MKRESDMMRNILLVMPRYSSTEGDAALPPIGILYISASMKKAGLPVFTLNLNMIKGSVEEELRSTILENDIHFIGAGGMIFDYPELEFIFSIAKSIRTNIVTFFGGSLVTHSPREAMNLVPSGDYAIIGEGDVIDCKLVETVSNDRDINEVEGVVYRRNGEVLFTPTPTEEVDLDLLPFPDYEGFEYLDMLKTKNASAKQLVLLTTSRSCPFNCTFCCREGKGTYRVRSLDLVFEEIDYLIKRYNVADFRISDELFADNLQRVEEFCERIKPYNVAWEAFLRISKNITIELLSKMKASGCYAVLYGLESASDTILRSMRKGTSEAELLRVLTITKEVGLATRGNFIFGDVLETKDTVQYTLDWVEKNYLLLEDVAVTPILMYPGSTLFKKAVSEGKITDTTQFIRDKFPLVNVSSMDEEEYQEMVIQTIPLFYGKIRLKYAEEDLKDLFLTKLDENGYLLQYPCPTCGEMLSFEILPYDIAFCVRTCSKCQSTRKFNLSSLYIQNFSACIDQFLKNNKLAIWGLAETFYQLYHVSETLQNGEIKIIDRNKTKQGLRIGNLPIVPPDVLLTDEIETVLIMNQHVSYAAIRNQILENYPKVKNIYWIYDLGQLNLL